MRNHRHTTDHCDWCEQLAEERAEGTLEPDDALLEMGVEPSWA